MAEAYTKTEKVSCLCVKLEDREEYNAVVRALRAYRGSQRPTGFSGSSDLQYRAASRVLLTIVQAKKKAENAGHAEYTGTDNNF